MYVPMDMKKWPKSWLTVEYKQYKRRHQFKLPEPEEISAPFSSILKNRVSCRKYDSSKEVTSKELSNLLYWSCGQKNIGITNNTQDQSRMYPSGGARYPLELYFAFIGNSEIPQGVYHYNVLNHSIEQVFESEGEKELRNIPTYPFAVDAQISLYISAIFERSMHKYRERGYRFIMLEVGIMLENLYLVSTALGLGSCALGTNKDTQIDAVLDLEEDVESTLSWVIVGHKKT